MYMYNAIYAGSLSQRIQKKQLPHNTFKIITLKTASGVDITIRELVFELFYAFSSQHLQ